MNIDDAKKLMEQGWKAREALEFEKAADLLEKAQLMFSQAEDWFNVTESLNHQVYLYRLKGLSELDKGNELALKSQKVAQEKGTKENLVLRALLSISIASGRFEESLGYAQKLVAAQQNPAAKGDLEEKLAMVLLRTGKADQAFTTIEQALGHIDEGWESERLPHKAIWKSGALITKARILYNMGNVSGAQDCAQEALALANQHELKPRKKEAEVFIDFLKSNA